MKKFLFECFNEIGVPVDVVRYGKDLSDATLKFWNDGYTRWTIWNYTEMK